MTTIAGWRVGYVHDGWLLSPFRGRGLDGRDLLEAALGGRTSTEPLRVHPTMTAECRVTVSGDPIPGMGQHAAPGPNCFCGINVIEDKRTACEFALSLTDPESVPVARRRPGGHPPEVAIYGARVTGCLPSTLPSDPAGTWRGSKMTITGPIIAEANGRELAQRYGVDTVDASVAAWLDAIPHTEADIPSYLTLPGRVAWADIGRWLTHHGVSFNGAAIRAELTRRGAM